ncbi:MAG: hypothetical protein EZS28_049988, partial [Streblomastix strix]
MEFSEQYFLLSDMLWADPAPSYRQDDIDEDGFCEGIRGPDSVMFTEKAVDIFLKNTGLTLIVRGHEDQTEGMQLTHNGKVFTVFSSSNYRDANSGACLLCHEKKLNIVIKQ